MYKSIVRFFTKKFTSIPLLWIRFDYKYFKKYGAKNSCWLNVHPELRNDKYIVDTLDSLVDYIRNKYDMNKMI